MTLESDTQFLLTQGRAGCKGSSKGTLAKTLWLALLATLLVSCTTPVPTDLEAAYNDKINEDWDRSLEIQQNPQAELSPDSDVALLRDAYAAEIIVDTAHYITKNYEYNLEAAIKYIEKQKFTCTTSERITCENRLNIMPLTFNPFPSLMNDPTHCITWRLEVQANRNTIETVTPSSLVTDCSE
ncbi:MAG: hypothetical protein RIC87_12835 [Kiloniellales bacterium]